MAYVYRYINLESREVIYIGKVKGTRDNWCDPLRARHEQHMREDWYKENAENIIMQFIEIESHADADILETWLISKYGTGQLLNKAKTGWGESRIDLWAQTVGHWRTYQKGCSQSMEAINEAANILYRVSEGLEYNVDTALSMFNEMIRETVSEKSKICRLSRFDEQEDFLRTQKKPEAPQ